MSKPKNSATTIQKKKENSTMLFRPVLGVVNMILSVKNWYISIKKKYFIRCWTSPQTMPLTAYAAILETGDMNYMRRKYKKGKIDLTDKFNAVYYSLMDEYGMSYEYKERLFREREVMILKIKWLETHEDEILNSIERIERELDEIYKHNEKPASIERQVAVMATYFGFLMRVRDLMVSEFFQLRKRYDEAIIELRKKNNKVYG